MANGLIKLDIQDFFIFEGVRAGGEASSIEALLSAVCGEAPSS